MIFSSCRALLFPRNKVAHDCRSKNGSGDDSEFTAYTVHFLSIQFWLLNPYTRFDRWSAETSSSQSRSESLSPNFYPLLFNPTTFIHRNYTHVRTWIHCYFAPWLECTRRRDTKMFQRAKLVCGFYFFALSFQKNTYSRIWLL